MTGYVTTAVVLLGVALGLTANSYRETNECKRQDRLPHVIVLRGSVQ